MTDSALAVSLLRNTRGKLFTATAVASAVALLVACGADGSDVNQGAAAPPPGSPSPLTTSTAEPSPSHRTYSSSAFTVPLKVEVPDWLPVTADVDRTHFLTWVPPEGPRVRFLQPTVVYQPGSSTPSTPPHNYLKYVLGLSDQGAEFVDQQQISVGGRPATILTATTVQPLDGVLGCPEPQMNPGDCFGLQPDVRARLAIVPIQDNKVLAIWLRTDVAADEQDTQAKVASFEHMLASLTFTGGTPAPAESAHAATPVDGVWSAHWTLQDMEKSPLLYDAGELNDENWGTKVITLSRGRGHGEMTNPQYHGENDFEYTVQGDVLTFYEGGGTQVFKFRWTITNNKLQLRRDEKLGEAPTGWLLKPFAHKS